MPDQKQSDEQQPDTLESPKPTVNSEFAELASKFVSMLELSFIGSIPNPTENDSLAVFRNNMLSSFIVSLLETGASRAEVAALLRGELGRILAPKDEEWSDTKNDRRIDLIDQSIQQSLSPDEAFELDQLTEQLRERCDTEDAIPMQGARKLHEYLLGLENSPREPD